MFVDHGDATRPEGLDLVVMNVLAAKDGRKEAQQAPPRDRTEQGDVEAFGAIRKSAV